MRTRRALLAATILAAWAAPIRGQEADSSPRSPSRDDREIAPVLGGEVTLIVPRGEFRRASPVAAGYGLRGGIGVADGMLSLGGAYRSITRDSREYGDTSVNNMLRTLAVEARLAAPFRAVRPYVGGSVGVAYFATESSVRRCCDENYETEDDLEGIRLVRFAPLASSRVGVVVDVPGGAWNGTLVSIDLAVEDHRGGRASYQTSGRGEVHTTRTNFRVFSLGVVVRSAAGGGHRMDRGAQGSMCRTARSSCASSATAVSSMISSSSRRQRHSSPASLTKTR